MTATFSLPQGILRMSSVKPEHQEHNVARFTQDLRTVGAGFSAPIAPVHFQRKLTEL
jgi:hypothetical protein